MGRFLPLKPGHHCHHLYQAPLLLLLTCCQIAEMLCWPPGLLLQRVCPHQTMHLYHCLMLRMAVGPGRCCWHPPAHH